MDKDAKDRFDRFAFEPFEPAQHADAQERIAHALEYIAAQLGEMNERARRKSGYDREGARVSPAEGRG